MRNFAEPMLLIFSSILMFGAIFLKLDDWTVFGIDLDVFLGVTGLIGVLLGFAGTIYSILRERKTKYPNVRIWISTSVTEKGRTLKLIAQAMGHGIMPHLDSVAIWFDKKSLIPIRIDEEPIAHKSGRFHTYELGPMLPGVQTADACAAYSYVTERWYFSAGFPRSHRLYKLRKRNEPPIISSEFTTDQPGHQINGQDVKFAQLVTIDAKSMLYYHERLKRWFNTKILRREEEGWPGTYGE